VTTESVYSQYATVTWAAVTSAHVSGASRLSPAPLIYRRKPVGLIRWNGSFCVARTPGAGSGGSLPLEHWNCDLRVRCSWTNLPDRPASRESYNSPPLPRRSLNAVCAAPSCRNGYLWQQSTLSARTTRMRAAFCGVTPARIRCRCFRHERCCDTLGPALRPPHRACRRMRARLITRRRAPGVRVFARVLTSVCTCTRAPSRRHCACPHATAACMTSR
jgi:hypothetical protein